MKIAFFHYSMQAGGAERTIANLSNYLVEKGDSVTIITADDRPAFYVLDQRVRQCSIHTARVSKNTWQAVQNNLFTVRQLKKVFREISPDIVICFETTSLFPVWLARNHRSYKIIGSERTNPFLDNGGFWNRIKGWISARCDGFVFQTAGARSYYPPKTQERSIILGNPLDPMQYESTRRDWSTRADLCAAGRLAAVKCFDDLLKAFAIVIRQYPSAALDLYGDGPEGERLEELAQQLGLQQNVHFCGRTQDMRSAYSQHKIFVMTSCLEGMPNVLMEALANGCACVATNCDFGPSELIRDGENGFLVPVHDVDAIAQYLCRLLGDDGLCRSLGEQAEAIRNTHSLEAIGCRFRQYLLQMLQVEG